MVDEHKYASKVARDMQTLTLATQTLGRSFAELGGTSNKVWTIIARLSSGSGLWKLQARVRSLSNMFELYYKAQDKSLTAMLDTIDASVKLEKAYKRTQERYKRFEKDMGASGPNAAQRKDDIFKMFKQQLGDEAKAYRQTQLMYLQMNEKFEKEMKTRNKALKKTLEVPASRKKWGFDLMKSWDEGGMLQKGSVLGDTKIVRGMKRVRDFGKVRRKDGELDQRYERGGILHGKGDKGKWFGKEGRLRRGFFGGPKKKLEKIKEKVIKKFWKILPKLDMMAKSVVQMIGRAMMTFFMLIPILLIVFVAIRKAWNPMAKRFRKLWPQVQEIGELLRELGGYMFKMGQAIWDGDIVEVLKIWFFKILPVVAKLIWKTVSLIIKTLRIIISELGRALVNAIIKLAKGVGEYVWSKLPSWFPGKHAGGVTQGGTNLVGEKGPEFVKLPAGSRVISHANSRGMGGTTINVNVTGRVGASDVEIRDIANKVAREINIRMNRQGTIAMGG